MIERLSKAVVFRFELGLSSSPDVSRSLKLVSSPSSASDNATQIITQPEFRALLSVLQEDAIVLVPGRFVGDEPVYYVNIATGDETLAGSLGYGRATLDTVTRLRETVAPAHRAKFDPHIDQLRKAFAP